MWVWCYPSVTAELRTLLLRKCCLTDENKLLHTFVFGQYKRSWFYITTVEVQDSPALKKVGLGGVFQENAGRAFAELPLWVKQCFPMEGNVRKRRDSGSCALTDAALSRCPTSLFLIWHQDMELQND